MDAIKNFFAAPQPVTPSTVDEALKDLNVSLVNLASVRDQHNQAAADYTVQAAALAAMAGQEAAEGERAARIHAKISDLLA